MGPLDPIFDMEPYMKEAKERERMLDEALGPELLTLHNATTRYYAWADPMGEWHEADTISPYFNFHTDDLFGIGAGNPIIQLLLGFGFGRRFSNRARIRAHSIMANIDMYANSLAKAKGAILAAEAEAAKRADENAEFAEYYNALAETDPEAAMNALVANKNYAAAKNILPKVKEYKANNKAKEKEREKEKKEYEDKIRWLEFKVEYALGHSGTMPDDDEDLENDARGMSCNGGGATYHQPADGGGIRYAQPLDGAIDPAFYKRLENAERLAQNSAKITNETHKMVCDLYANKRAQEDRK